MMFYVKYRSSIAISVEIVFYITLNKTWNPQDSGGYELYVDKGSLDNVLCQMSKL